MYMGMKKVEIKFQQCYVTKVEKLLYAGNNLDKKRLGIYYTFLKYIER